MLRRSLSSEAAASLDIALTRAACAIGSFVRSNQSPASGRPPCSLARSRTMRAEPIWKPDAALAKVLARTILACSIAFGGKAAISIRLNKRASASASGADAVCWAEAPRREADAAAAIIPPVNAPRNSIRRLRQGALMQAADLKADSM